MAQADIIQDELFPSASASAQDWDDGGAEAVAVLHKAPGAFKTISEVAAQLDLPQHVLRFWETRFKQIKPTKLRGGRRYYRPEDIEVISTIKHLLYTEGYTIDGAKRAFEQARKTRKQEHAPKAVQASLAALVRHSADALAPEIELEISVEPPLRAAVAAEALAYVPVDAIVLPSQMERADHSPLSNVSRHRLEGVREELRELQQRVEQLRALCHAGA